VDEKIRHNAFSLSRCKKPHWLWDNPIIFHREYYAKKLGMQGISREDIYIASKVFSQRNGVKEMRNGQKWGHRNGVNRNGNGNGVSRK